MSHWHYPISPVYIDNTLGAYVFHAAVADLTILLMLQLLVHVYITSKDLWGDFAHKPYVNDSIAASIPCQGLMIDLDRNSRVFVIYI